MLIEFNKRDIRVRVFTLKSNTAQGFFLTELSHIFILGFKKLDKLYKKRLKYSQAKTTTNTTNSNCCLNMSSTCVYYSLT